jgi:NapC/NirT cytochrome c family, N-terminal region
MIWRPNRPLIDILTGHWVSMTGTALVTLAGVSWLFLLPMHISGRADNPYIGLFAFVVLPLIFFTGLILIPIGAVLGRRRLEHGAAVAVDRHEVWRRAGIFFAVMTAANLVIGSQLTYRAVGYMDTVQFCGQTCHVMKPEFTARQRPPHAAVACESCHIAPGASGFIKAKMAGTRQLVGVILNNYSRPIESAMESNRLVSSAETCEQCHARNKPMSPKLRVISKYNADEANSPTQTVLMVMVDKIHSTHLARGVAIRYAASDKKRQTIPWVEYRDPSGMVRTYLASDTKPEQAAALPKFEMQCVDCHNRAAHSFQTADRALDGAIASGRIASNLPFIKKTGLELLQKPYANAGDAAARIGAQLNDFYRQKYPDVFSQRSNDIQSAARSLADIYNSNVFPDLKVTWGTYPNNLGHVDYPGCFRCHDGGHVTTANDAITQDCAACHNAIAVEESSPEVLKTLGLEK